MRCFLQFGKRKEFLCSWHMRKRSEYQFLRHSLWCMGFAKYSAASFQIQPGKFSPIFNLMTKLFYNKQYQLYHKAETDCFLLTSFIFAKAHFLCPREVPALLSFRLLNGNFGMFASSLCWRVKIYSGIQNFTMSLVLDNPRINYTKFIDRLKDLANRSQSNTKHLKLLQP